MGWLVKLHFKYVIVPVTLLVLVACGSGSPEHSEEQPLPEWQTGIAIPDNRYVDHYKILLLGNSHVYVNDLGGVITQLIRAGRPEASAHASVVGDSMFLDERLQDGTSLAKLQSEPWTHVILQGQKYSMSGAIDYPTDASIYWIQAVKHHKATPLMFPEHPRAGYFEEGARVHAIHAGIAKQEKSCVAPVGLAFDQLRELAPDIRVHQADGNHTSINGTFLTALVFYQAITGQTADSLPDLTEIAVSAQTQQLMRQIASATLAQHPACIF